MNTSQQGYIFERAILESPIFKGYGRVATKQEQLQEQVDFIYSDEYGGHKVDIKFQPKAYQYKTINIELSEYNSINPSIRRDSWWFTSTASLYAWFVGPDQYFIFFKEDLRKYVDAFRNKDGSEEYEEMVEEGAKLCYGNGFTARKMSSNHGSSKFDNAETIRIPISILRKISEATFTFNTSSLFTS